MSIHTLFDTDSSKYENFNSLAFLRRAKRNFISIIRKFMAWWSYNSKKKRGFFLPWRVKTSISSGAFQEESEKLSKNVDSLFFQPEKCWQSASFWFRNTIDTFKHRKWYKLLISNGNTWIRIICTHLAHHHCCLVLTKISPHMTFPRYKIGDVN